MAIDVKSKLQSHPVEMDVDMEKHTAEDSTDGDLYTTLKNLQRQLEFYEIQVYNLIHGMTWTFPACSFTVTSPSNTADKSVPWLFAGQLSCGVCAGRLLLSRLYVMQQQCYREGSQPPALPPVSLQSPWQRSVLLAAAPLSTHSRNNEDVSQKQQGCWSRCPAFAYLRSQTDRQLDGQCLHRLPFFI